MTEPGFSAPVPPTDRPAPIELDFNQRARRDQRESRPNRTAPPPPPPHPPSRAEAQAWPHQQDISFSGSGSEYFRIWIVNLLLTIVTLSLYYPWAKVRRLRYFHTNTHVAGHALDFHGEPTKMLRGHLLVLALGAAYVLADKVSPVAQSAALLVLALIWPALWLSSLQFRLANTSWRGLRFRFTGSMGGAYGALLLPFVLVFGAAMLMAVVTPALGQTGGLLGLLALVYIYGSLPYFWLRLKRFQHNHYAYAQLESQLDTTVGATYATFLKIAGVALLTMLIALVPFGIFTALMFGGLYGAGGATSASQVLVQLTAYAPLMTLGFLLLQAVPRAYATSRMQNLLWSGTGSSSLRFQSSLRAGPLARLLIKNWLLVIVTLGLYWPWAAVAVARMRLEAVGLGTRDSIDALTAVGTSRRGDAAGDAAGDAFGIDLGL